MVTKKIAYVDLNGQECEKEFMFNLNKQDFVRLELRYDLGIVHITPPTPETNPELFNPDGTNKTNIQIAYETFIKNKNLEAAYDLLTDLICSAYGVREEDSFVKNRRINGRDTRPDLANFNGHPAFDALMMDLMGDPGMLLLFFRNLATVKMSDEDFSKMALTVKQEVERETANPEIAASIEAALALEEAAVKQDM